MTAEDAYNTEGAEELERALEATGLNPHSLAERTHGRVSDATIRNYLKAGPYTRSRLRALAEALGVPWGERVLLAYGEEEMAADVATHLGATNTGSGELVRIQESVGITDEVHAVITRSMFRNDDKLTDEQRAKVQGYIDRLIEEEAND